MSYCLKTHDDIDERKSKIMKMLAETVHCRILEETVEFRIFQNDLELSISCWTLSNKACHRDSFDQ